MVSKQTKNRFRHRQILQIYHLETIVAILNLVTLSLSENWDMTLEWAKSVVIW